MMMKEKDIRTFIPFLVVFVSTFFLSGADMFEDFGSVLNKVGQNGKLIWLLISSDIFQSVVWLLCSSVFFTAWIIIRKKQAWYTDILWQLGGVLICWFLLAIVRIWGIFHQLLWIQGMLSFFVAVFGLYFFNTLWRARKLIYYPNTPEEAMIKAKKFDELIKYFKDDTSAPGK